MKSILHNSWSFVELCDIAEIITGTTPPKNDPQNYGNDFPLFKPKDLNAGINVNTSIDSLSKIGISKARLLPKGSVLVTCIGATIGKTGLIRVSGASNQQINALIPNKNFSSSYLYYNCISDGFQSQIRKNSSSTTLPIINKTKFEKLVVPLPPLEVQHKIVAKIEELFSELDNGVEQLKKAKEQLKTYRQAVLKYAFEGKLTEEFREKNKHLLWEQEVNTKDSTPDEFKDKELPVGWKWVKIRDCGTVVGGGTPSTKISEYFDGNISWITPADLSHYSEKYISKGKRNISALGLSKSSAKLLPKGSIMFSSRAPIGYVAIASNDICTNQGFKSIIPKKSFSSEYIYYYLLGSKRLAENFASGTTFKEISLRNFSNMPVPITPAKEQAQVVSEIEKRFSEADNLEKSIEQSLEKAESLRQSILKQAFEGNLV